MRDFDKVGEEYILDRNDLFLYEREDLKKWFEVVKYSQDLKRIDRAAVEDCFRTLVKAELIDKDEVEIRERNNQGKQLIEKIVATGLCTLNRKIFASSSILRNG